MTFQVNGIRTFGTVGLAWAEAWGCFLVGWAIVSNSLGQGRLWVSREGVWIQICRYWGATDRLYAGGLGDLICSFRKLF